MTISKFIDFYTTQLKIKYINDETNLIGRSFMPGGIKKGIWLIFSISLIIIFISTWILQEFYSLPVYYWLYIGTGIIITVVQLAVAHSIYFGKSNFIVSLLKKTIFYRW